MTPATPLRDDTATTRPPGRCAGCGQTFIPAGRARHCSAACRKRVFRARHQPVADRVVDLAKPPAGGRREHSIYECPDCGVRQLGVQRCADCGRFGRAVGLGGACPGCGEPVTLTDLGLKPKAPR
ncbi:MAG: hypothetical protein LC749_00925 [Actinobacteria bacterium]|nr:hypothetical protein [Actinomycetota bacterium]